MLVTLPIILVGFLAGQTTSVALSRKPSSAYFGYCYDIKTPIDFDFKTFSTGKWFEISKYDNNFEGISTDCVEQTFFLDEGASSIDIAYSLRFKNGTQGLLQAAMTYERKNNETLLSVTYPDEPTKADFDVLTTDFNSYAIIYSCLQVSTEGIPVKDERLWVLSRNPELSEEAEDAVEAGLIYNGDSLAAYLYDVNQDNCVTK